MKNVCLLLFLISSPSLFAYQSHESIVKEFIRQNDSVVNVRPIPTFMDNYIIPRLDEVIPKYMQKKLRNSPIQVEPIFDGLKGRDLRYRDTPIVSQLGARCSAYGLVASIENLLGVPVVAKISESHLWSAYRKYSSVSAVEAAKRMSITEYAMWPKERKNPLNGWEAKAHTSLKHITYIADNVLSAVKAVDEGRPVYIGLSVTSSMQSCTPVLDPDSPETGGGHAISISGYRIDKAVPGGGYFIVKNSWGSDCGDKGYQYLPFNHCIRRGSSYCIMWEIQGVKTGFPGVSSIEPEIPSFDMRKMRVRIYYHRPWYSAYKRVVVEIEGDSLHARQIKEISFSIDNGPYSKPVPNDIDSVVWGFSTKASKHYIRLRIMLNNGTQVENLQTWGL